MAKTDHSPSVGERIKAARKRRRKTRNELAEMLSMTAGNLYLMESGRSGVSVDQLQRIAKALNVRAVDLMPEADEPVSVLDFEQNVVDLIMAGVKEGSEADFIALQVSDQAMIPAYKPGDIVVGRKTDPAECRGLDCIVEVEGRLMVRRVHPGSGNHYNLLPYNPAFEPIADAAITWAAPIQRIERAPR